MAHHWAYSVAKATATMIVAWLILSPLCDQSYSYNDCCMAGLETTLWTKLQLQWLLLESSWTQLILCLSLSLSVSFSICPFSLSLSLSLPYSPPTNFKATSTHSIATATESSDEFVFFTRTSVSQITLLSGKKTLLPPACEHQRLLFEHPTALFRTLSPKRKKPVLPSNTRFGHHNLWHGNCRSNTPIFWCCQSHHLDATIPTQDPLAHTGLSSSRGWRSTCTCLHATYLRATRILRMFPPKKIWKIPLGILGQKTIKWMSVLLHFGQDTNVFLGTWFHSKILSRFWFWTEMCTLCRKTCWK